VRSAADVAIGNRIAEHGVSILRSESKPEFTPMLTLSAAAVLSAALFASDPKVAEVVSINQPGGWKLEISEDGSANLRYHTDAGNVYAVPAGTFDAEHIRKTLLALPSATKDESRRRMHYLYWFEAQQFVKTFGTHVREFSPF